MKAVLFYVFAAVALCGALNVLWQKRVLHAAIALVVSLLGTAGVFFLLGAPFIGWIQLIVYAGAVMVLFVLTIMLVGPYAASGVRGDRFLWRLQAVLLGVGVLLLPLYAANLHLGPVGAPPATGAKALGQHLFTRYLLPFELISLLVLIALVGAVVLAKKSPPEEA